MRARAVTTLLLLAAAAGCVLPGTEGPAATSAGADDAALVASHFTLVTLPAVFGGPVDDPTSAPIGLYEPTIDVGPEGNLYVSAHSTSVGRYPAPAYVSTDDGATWSAMALAANYQGKPGEQMSAPLFSDEVFIVAGEEGMAWGADCCNERMEFPVVGWCADGAEVCHYNQNAVDHTRYALDASPDCVASPGTDRPWLAYAGGKLLMVNNPGGALVSASGQIPLQVGSMDVPPMTPLAYTGLAWGAQWNLCASTGGFIPGIPDMREDHFFAVPQWIDFNTEGCGATTHYDVITGIADDMHTLTQTTVFENSHVAPGEKDSSPSNVGHYGQAVFDAEGALYVGAMNNSAIEDADGECIADPSTGAIHLAVSVDDATTFVETTFRFARPVSSFYLDGNRHGAGSLLSWGEIDGDHTDWYVGHVFRNDDGTLRLDDAMLAVDDGPEASRHVQGAALGPDGRAYLALSMNSQNPGGAQAARGDTPLRVAIQQDGPTMPVS
ncbi:MAG TPA: hypothetical protein VM370_06220 [Candidatus Thermoplasmatota archaeon]|nr:hypothetical protein [Candidatus Thermoplasmatota archaeon]